MIIFISEALNSNESLIKNAIDQKKIITFFYGKGGKRTVEPYHLGKTARGNYALRGYQLNGYSETENDRYKIFILGYINYVKITDSIFEVRQDYKQTDKNIDIEYQIQI